MLMYFGDSGGGVKGVMPEFTYSGTYQLIDDGKSGSVQNWRIKFLTSGVLRFNKVPDSIDVFLVGGGGGGATGFYDGSIFVGYGGSGGGYTKTVKAVKVEAGKDYTIVIGDGGAVSNKYTNHRGGTTSGFGYEAEGGYPGSYTGSAAAGTLNPKGGNGGSGGADYITYPPQGYEGGYDGSNGGGTDGGTGQGSTTAEFGEAGQTVYSTGGSTSDTGKGTTAQNPNGAANTGNGGTSRGSSSVGGSGILVIRNAR